MGGNKVGTVTTVTLRIVTQPCSCLYLLKWVIFFSVFRDEAPSMILLGGDHPKVIQLRSSFFLFSSGFWSTHLYIHTITRYHQQALSPAPLTVFLYSSHLMHLIHKVSKPPHNKQTQHALNAIFFFTLLQGNQFQYHLLILERLSR